MPGATRLKVASLTNSAESGDFKRAVAVNTNIPIGDYPVVLVIKKHRSILNYLRKWIVEVEGRPTGQGDRKIVRDVPLLVIDDEADNASVNVAAVDEDTEPSSINAAHPGISWRASTRPPTSGTRPRRSPTSTSTRPTDHDQYGLDIFPRHFIESLPAAVELPRPRTGLRPAVRRP